MKIEKIIISKDVCNYLEKKGHVFSDFEMATLIYNSRTDMYERLDSLRQVAKNTENLDLKQQIKETIQYENCRIEKMKSNTGEYVYKLEIWEEADGEYQGAGFFRMVFLLTHNKSWACLRVNKSGAYSKIHIPPYYKNRVLNWSILD